MGLSALATVVTGPWALLLCSACPWQAKRGGRVVIPHTTVRSLLQIMSPDVTVTDPESLIQAVLNTQSLSDTY